ncbi:MAG TPA: prolipoprotein diacylglyceryl transferase [Lacisediminihabitans sp.]
MRDIGLGWFTLNVDVRAYAICILIGIVVAALLTNRRLKQRGAEPGIVLDVALWSVVLGIIGARIFHVLTHPDDYFGAGKNLWAVFYVWEGGIAIFGALIGGAIGTYIGCRITGLRFWSFADALAPGLLLAQALGRFGNYFNHELFGLPTNLPWGLQIESDNPAVPVGLPAGTLFLPTFLYEIIWDLIGVAVILYLGRRFRLQWGKTIAVYFIWYGIGRSYLESIRIDPSLIFLGVRTNIWAAWAAIVVGLVIFIVQSRRHPGLEPSPYLPGREWSPKPAVDSQDTYSDTDDDGNDAGITTPTASGSRVAEKTVTSGTGTNS